MISFDTLPNNFNRFNDQFCFASILGYIIHCSFHMLFNLKHQSHQNIATQQHIPSYVLHILSNHYFSKTTAHFFKDINIFKRKILKHLLSDFATPDYILISLSRPRKTIIRGQPPTVMLYKYVKNTLYTLMRCYSTTIGLVTIIIGKNQHILHIQC